MESGREKLDSSEAGMSKPSQEDVETSGTTEAVLESEREPSETVKEQVPEERYWSILTRKRSLSPEKRAVESVPVNVSDKFGFFPSYCSGVFPSGLSATESEVSS